MNNFLLVVVAWFIVFMLAFPAFIVKTLHLILTSKGVVSKYLLRVAIGLDQLGSSILNWNEDETMSSYIGRMKQNGTIHEPWTTLCKILNKLDVRHCIKNIGE